MEPNHQITKRYDARQKNVTGKQKAERILNAANVAKLAKAKFNDSMQAA